MTDKALEVNFDGLIGNTHHFGGLALGNLASSKNKYQVSHPRKAALQGLAKMEKLHALGIPQALLPPMERPDIQALREIGYTGTAGEILNRVAREKPDLLGSVSSASNAWTANAATISPSADTRDGKVHITPANLSRQYHRSLEAPFTFKILKHLFHDSDFFTVHEPLPSGHHYGDEGAANHARLCTDYASPGLEIFVYGCEAVATFQNGPKKFQARQTFEASLAVSHHHQLDPKKTFYVQQNPDCIDAGVFHNDVIAVANQNVFLCHALSYDPEIPFVEKLKDKYLSLTGKDLHTIVVSQDSLSLEDAVATYFFNSQLVSLPGGEMAMLLPAECREHPSVQKVLDTILHGDNPVSSLHFIDLSESMRNGGGPACLRLRIVLTASELASVHPGVFLNQDKFKALKEWINRHYRETLELTDLANIQILEETRAALTELTDILQLGPVYPFQINP